MQTQKKFNSRRLAIIAVVTLIVAITIAVVSMFLMADFRDGKFEDLFLEANEHYNDGNFNRAVEVLEEALTYGESEDCYILLANTYYAGLDDIDSAIATLYKASSRIESTVISNYLEQLKSLKSESAQTVPEDAVQIAGETISGQVTSLVLSQKRLVDADIAPLAQLTNLKSLSLSENGITDVSILSGLTELNFLKLENNQITDISTLSNLTNLESLYLDGNMISDFTPLHGLSKLTTLSLNQTGISTEQLDALADALLNCTIRNENYTLEEKAVEITIGDVTFMSDVTELDLSDQNISDIRALSRCSNLERLNLSGNNVTDLTPLLDLHNLTWLNLMDNRVSDLLPLMGLSKLTYLDVENNYLEDITAVSAMVYLEELYLSQNRLDSIEPITSLSYLKKLGLKDVGLTNDDLDELKGMSGLQELSIDTNSSLTGDAVDKLKEAIPNCTVSHSKLVYRINIGGSAFDSDETDVSITDGSVSSLEGVQYFEDLRRLSVVNSSVTDLSPISNLENLTALEIWSNDSTNKGSLSDLSPLSKISTLQTVNLMRNNISDIHGLSSSASISELYLNGNNISDLSPLAGMTSLSSLSLDENQPSNLSVLEGLTGLKTLSLQYCGLNDVSSISNLNGLQELYLDGNNISDIDALSNLTSLRSLHLSNNNLSAQQILDLQEALPNCSIQTDIDLTVVQVPVEPTTSPPPLVTQTTPPEESPEVDETTPEASEASDAEMPIIQRDILVGDNSALSSGPSQKFNFVELNK